MPDGITKFNLQPTLKRTMVIIFTSVEENTEVIPADTTIKILYYTIKGKTLFVAH